MIRRAIYNPKLQNITNMVIKIFEKPLNKGVLKVVLKEGTDLTNEVRASDSLAATSQLKYG